MVLNQAASQCDHALPRASVLLPLAYAPPARASWNTGDEAEAGEVAAEGGGNAGECEGG